MASMIKFVVKPDANGSLPTWAIRQSQYVNSFTLAAGIARTATVPAEAGMVMFSSDVNIYVKVGGAAAVPADVTDGSASELNPSALVVSPGETIGIISPSAGTVTLSYFR